MIRQAASLGTDKQPERISSMFDAIAHRYDLLNRLLSGGLDILWRKNAIRALDLRAGETVVDLCTGTGDLAIEAIHSGAGRVVGLDFSGEMLRFGAKKLARRSLGTRVRLVQADAMHIPLKDVSADAATVAFGIRNVEHPEQACADLFRVLRPGGRFAILEFGIPPNPLIRRAYLWYFHHILPRVGRLISGHTSAYTYLPASVSSFPEPPRLSALLENVGFRAVRAVPLTFGVVYLYVARKPPLH